MRRAAVVVVAATALAVSGCGYEGTTKPLPETVIGSVPQEQTTTTLAKGDPAAGKKLFASNGCGGCHTYAPANSNGQTGPDLDKLAGYAKNAGKPLGEFVQESIVNPGSYVEDGYQNVMPTSYGNLPQKQLADLVAFLTAKQ
jgi:mono/diheme cytochrome c family protein